MPGTNYFMFRSRVRNGKERFVSQSIERSLLVETERSVDWLLGWLGEAYRLPSCRSGPQIIVPEVSAKCTLSRQSFPIFAWLGSKNSTWPLSLVLPVIEFSSNRSAWASWLPLCARCAFWRERKGL